LWRGVDDDEPDASPGVLAVAGVTLANGGDNIGVYVPVFTVADSLWVYVAVFLVLVGVWCLAGWFLASRQVVARALAKWGHIALPVVLIVIGLLVLFSG
jgi:cadmium resistance protein CadD (predicted permease)